MISQQQKIRPVLKLNLIDRIQPMILRTNKKKLIYKAINSCIAFVPTLHGKQLILVEDLLNKNGSLHPVQKAMVDYHGSQCGFCTPGFIMSLFAMHKKNKSYPILVK